MSGICGIVNLGGAPVTPELLQKITVAASHRGPDGIGYWIGGNAGLSHLRLETVDSCLAKKQPLCSATGTLCLTADARVDNRDELIQAMAAQNCVQPTNATDAALILAAHGCWGEKCAERIVGDFAFILWDIEKQCLFCARDVFGVKPLHYARIADTLCVASEAQQLLQHPMVGRSLDEVAIADHLTNNCCDTGRTIFFDVHCLPPAHYLVATATRVEIKQYWDIDPNIHIRYKRDEDYALHFLDLFRQVIRDRLRTSSEVVSILLSGGLDSCSIAAVAQQELDKIEAPPRLTAFSYAFDELSECDERLYTRALADELGIEVKYVQAERFWLLDDPEAFQPVLETPFMGWESIEQHVFAQVVQMGGRVLLTGHGGDSLVRGSALIYLDQLLSKRVMVLVEMLRQAREEHVQYLPLLRAYLVRPLKPDGVVARMRKGLRSGGRPPVPEWLAPGLVQKMDGAECLMPPRTPLLFGSLARQDVYDYAVGLGSVGRAVYWYDRVAARFGLEVRHPFLDRRIVEFLLAIPTEQLMRVEQRKWLLRRAMIDVLPEVVRVRRNKTRFTAYIDMGLRDKESNQVRELFKNPLLAKYGFVDAHKLQLAYESYCQGDRSYSGGDFWFPVTLELWLKRYHAVFDVRS